MSSHRPERIADLLHQILAGLVRDKLRDPRIGFVTLTEVRVSPDLRHARVFVSKLGEISERDETVAALNHAAPYLRREVAHRARLKYVPDLEFIGDRAIETGMRVESLIQDFHRGDDPDEGGHDESD